VKVGEIVHYVSHGTPVRADGTQAFTAKCRAAIISEIDLDSVAIGLVVLNPTGQFFHSLASGGCLRERADRMTGGTWHALEEHRG
jgi:hypothetical protein